KDAKPTDVKPADAARGKTEPVKSAVPPTAKELEAKFETQLLDYDVALFLRKQAVRALSKVRTVAVPGANRSVGARPGLTLARTATRWRTATGRSSTSW